MAMTAFELFGVLKLDASEFHKGLDNARDTAGRAGGAIGGALATAAKVGMVAVTAATGAAVAFGKSSINAASSFESAFTGVKKTVDATEAEYEQLSNWIMEASTKMASSKEEIAGTMEIAGQLGIRGVEGLQKFTETMIMLGDTTNLSAEEAASALAKFGNIAGISAEDTDRIGSVIVDLGNNFATTEADIVNMSTRLASAGTIAGLSATDILALSTAMSSVGINAEAGGTAMSTILTKIGRAVDGGITPANEKLQTFAATAGMTAEEFAAAWKSDPTVALSGFIKGLDGVIDQGGNVTAILDDLGIKGIREANTVRSLALASDVLTSAVDKANTAFEENNALQHEAEMRYGTTESQAMQAAEALKNLKIIIGEELMPTYGEFMSFSKTALDEITKGLQEGGLTGMMEAVGTAISDALNMLTEKLPTFVTAGMQLLGALGQGILDNLDVIIDAGIQIMGELGKALITGLPAIIDAGLQIVEALLTAMAENIDAIMEGARQLIEGIGEAINAHGPEIMELALFIIETLVNSLIDGIPQLFEFVTQMILSFAQWVGENTDKMVDTAVALITALGEGLIQNIPILMEAGVDIILGLVEALTDPNTISTILEVGLDVILALVDGIINALPKIIEAAPTIVQNLVDGIIQALPKIIDAAVALIGALVEGILSNFNQLIAASLQIILALVEGLLQALPHLIAAAPKLIGELVSAIIKSLPQVVSGAIQIVTSLIKGIVGAFPMLLEVGTRTVIEFVGAIAKAGAEVIAAGKEMINEVWEGIKSLNPIEWGRDLIDSFIDGIKERISRVADAARDVAQTVKDILGFSEPEEGPLSNFHTYAPDMMKLFAQGIKDNEDMLHRQVEQAFDFADMTVSALPVMNASDSDIKSTSGNNITLNIYGAEGQNVNELADAVQDRILHMMGRTGAVYA